MNNYKEDLNRINLLKKRVLELSFKLNASHLSSTISSVPILFDIYSKKKECDKVVLSSGHSGLALYVVLEHFYGFDAETIYKKHGVHPYRDIEFKIDCSTGSLGQGITIACGMAIADKNRDVWVCISDGEFYEGCVFESLNFVDKYCLNNLHIYVNLNGHGAIEEIESNKIYSKIKALIPNHKNTRFYFSEALDLNLVKGIECHYYKFKNYEDYEIASNLF